MRRGIVYEITYRMGNEEKNVVGFWNGECDGNGRLLIVPLYEPILYLFAWQIVRLCEVFLDNAA